MQLNGTRVPILKPVIPKNKRPAVQGFFPKREPKVFRIGKA
jgi:hypothetical protein